MKANGSRGATRAKKVPITIADPAATRAPDLLNRQLADKAPDLLNRQLADKAPDLVNRQFADKATDRLRSPASSTFAWPVARSPPPHS